MKYAALATAAALILFVALFVRTEKELGVKRVSYVMSKYELYDVFRRQAGIDFEKKWNQEHPTDPIQVRYDPINEDSYTPKLNAEIVAGTLQDVLVVEEFREYVRRGILLDLTPYVKKYHAQPLLDKIYPELIEAHTVEGHLYGLPNNLNTDVLFYNRTLFDREGMAYPTADWTWNDMLKAAQKLTKRDAKGRLAQSGLTPEITAVWIGWNGGRFWTPDGTRCVVNSPQALAAVQFLHDLQYKYRVCPTQSEMRDVSGNVNFQNNCTAMMIGGRWWTALFKGLSDVNWAVAPLPKSFCGRRPGWVGFNSLTINAKTRYPDIAFQFLLHLTTPEQIKHLVDVGDSMPIHAGPAENEYFLNDASRPKGENYAYLMGMSDPMMMLGTDFYSPEIPVQEVDMQMKQFDNAFAEPDADVPKLLRELQDNLNALYAARTALPVKPSVPAFVLALGLAASGFGAAAVWRMRAVQRARRAGTRPA